MAKYSHFLLSRSHYTANMSYVIETFKRQPGRERVSESDEDDTCCIFFVSQRNFFNKFDDGDSNDAIKGIMQRTEKMGNDKKAKN